MSAIENKFAAKAASSAAPPPEIAETKDLFIGDMPDKVLDGRLGEWCHQYFGDFCNAYSWPAVTAAASVHVRPDNDKQRCNLYWGPVGDPGTGKSSAGKRAEYYFQLPALDLVDETMYGSVEGMFEKIGVRSTPLLWSPDELAHTLTKAQIEGSAFSYVLNTAFYKDSNNLTVAKRKAIECNVRLSIFGGIVLKNFENCFGSETLYGLYDRFLFSVAPTGFQWSYRPIEGEPLVNLTENNLELGSKGPEIIAPRIDRSVWEARDAIVKNEEIEPRVLELCLRVATVCAAWDGKPLLLDSDLGPAWELARYQKRVRDFLKPNEGRNFEAMAAFKILNYLKRNKTEDKFLNLRDVKRATHVMEFGPNVVDRVIRSLCLGGDIELQSIPPESGGKTKFLIRLAKP